MAYSISVDDDKSIILVSWDGFIDFAILKRHFLSYNHHMTHGGYNVIYDFTNVNSIDLTQEDMSRLAVLAGQVLDPLHKDIKVAMLTADDNVESFAKRFVTVRHV